MNKIRTARCAGRLLSLMLCLIFYGGVGAFLLWQSRQPEKPRMSSPQPVTLSFEQMALQAAVPEEKQPEPVVEKIPEPLPEPVPQEEQADIAVEEVVETQPEPEPQPVQAEAQVTQEAAAPDIQPVAKDVLLAWVQEQIEKEKYYPASARNAGYEGTFRLEVKIGADGTISETAVLDGKGHPLLRQALKKILNELPGRTFGQPLPEPVDLTFEFEFKLD